MAAHNSVYKPLLAVGMRRVSLLVTLCYLDHKRFDHATAHTRGRCSSFKKRDMLIKIIEIVTNLIVLIWLLMISFLTHPFDINQEGLPFNINDQYGNSYILMITVSMIFSILIILRLVKRNVGLRITSIIIILITVSLTIVYWNDYHRFSEMIRNTIYGPL